MSLFKARDFWSFDLGDLPKLDRSSADQTTNDDTEEDGDELVEGGDFVADLGRFQAINNGQHDVLVCANLRGLVLIIQVPQHEQEKKLAPQRTTSGATPEQTGNSTDEAQRQLLLAKKLDPEAGQQPLVLVDLKCGYFASTSKQSIAVLTTSRLLVFQVKQQTMDLLGEPIALSHCLEEQYRIDLIGGQLAQSILVLSRRPAQEEDDTDDRRKTTICLGQRDLIAVQYTNQLLFSLVDYKKLLAHYKLKAASDPPMKDQSMLRLTESTGRMPGAFLQETQSLVISQTDRRISCLPLSKLSAQAKESVVRRVAKNLLASSLSYGGDNQQLLADQMIELDLDEASDWQREIINLPLQLIAIARQRAAQGSSSQLLVVSRYNLDLYASSGDHLWSQRSETALICAQIYTKKRASGGGGGQQQQTATTNQEQLFADQLFTLVCSDCLSQDKSNLCIMREDQTVWSALLNSKPIQLWRAKLQKMSGLLVSLDAIKGQVKVSYLGTNNDEELKMDDDDDHSEASNRDACLGQLETLDEFFSSHMEANRQQQSKAAPLSVQVRLEASNQWPNVCIDCRISISPAQTAPVGRLLQDIVLLVDFDESLHFELAQQSGLAKVALQEVGQSALQLHLGNCWPDRREPLTVEGKFALRSSRGANLMMEESQTPDAAGATKSLKVNLLFRFHELHSGSVLQRESFLLPLSLVGQLTLIDYCSGANDASLEDVLANLGPTYSRPPLGEASSFKSCDIYLRSGIDLLELTDELIEADLVCRGLQQQPQQSGETLADRSQPSPNDDDADEEQVKRRQSRRMSTLENISLLAQSLDCRLRFKSLARPGGVSRRQDTGDNEELCGAADGVAMISIGLRLPTSSSLNYTTEAELGFDSQVWLHLLDLQTLLANPPNKLVEQFVRLHLAEWKWQNEGVQTNANSAEKSNPILLSIESEDGQAILFMQNHLIERIRQTKTIHHQQVRFSNLHEFQHDSIEICLKNMLTIEGPFLAPNVQMDNYLRELIEWHKIEVQQKSKQTKEQLGREFCKFQVTSAASLSLAKRLSSLPDEMQDQFNVLSKITSQIQLNLTRLLAEMDRLQRLDRMFARISVPPEALRGGAD